MPALLDTSNILRCATVVVSGRKTAIVIPAGSPDLPVSTLAVGHLSDERDASPETMVCLNDPRFDIAPRAPGFRMDASRSGGRASLSRACLRIGPVLASVSRRASTRTSSRTSHWLTRISKRPYTRAGTRDARSSRLPQRNKAPGVPHTTQLTLLQSRQDRDFVLACCRAKLHE